MRINKYRAWDGKRMTTSGIMFNNSTGCIDLPIGAQMKLMQFIRLLDRNGKEIYEGDIVNVDDSVCGNPIDGYKEGVYKVEYCLPDCAFCLVQLDEMGGIAFNEVMEYEIIGNIHENPELL